MLFPPLFTEHLNAFQACINSSKNSELEIFSFNTNGKPSEVLLGSNSSLKMVFQAWFLLNIGLRTRFPGVEVKNRCLFNTYTSQI